MFVSLTLHCSYEFVLRYIRLTKHAGQRSNLDFAMQRNDAAFGTSPHDDVAAGLTNLHETQTFKRLDKGCPGNAGQFRHARER